MRLLNVCWVPPDWSDTVIVWPVAAMEPVLASGVPPCPRALPSATTDSPTETLVPVAIVFRPETPSTFRRATSSLTL